MVQPSVVTRLFESASVGGSSIVCGDVLGGAFLGAGSSCAGSAVIAVRVVNGGVGISGACMIVGPITSIATAAAAAARVMPTVILVEFDLRFGGAGSGSVAGGGGVCSGSLSSIIGGSIISSESSLGRSSSSSLGRSSSSAAGAGAGVFLAKRSNVACIFSSPSVS